MIDLEKETYTKEEVAQMLNEYDVKVNEFNAQLADVTGRYSEATKQLESMEELEKNNLHTNIKLEMARAGINDELFDLVVADDIDVAKSKIEKVVGLHKQNVINQSYKPQQRSTGSSEYEVAEKQGNIEGMLKSKLSRIFG